MLFCEHDDELFDKTTLESAYEQMIVGGVRYKTLPIEPFFYRKKVVVLLKCKKCNRVKKVIESNP